MPRKNKSSLFSMRAIHLGVFGCEQESGAEVADFASEDLKSNPKKEHPTT
jgi:hypothetical protein